MQCHTACAMNDQLYKKVKKEEGCEWHVLQNLKTGPMSSRSKRTVENTAIRTCSRSSNG